MPRKNGVSVKQLAQELGLSQGTVSIVLNGRGDEMRISKTTQERVLSLARAKGYQPSRYPKPPCAGPDGQTPLVSLFCPYMKGAEPLGRVLGGIQRAVLFDKMNVEIVIKPFERGKLGERAHLLSKEYCDGAIVLSGLAEDDTLLQNSQFNIPIVAFNNINEGFSGVCVDYYEAGSKVARLFKERGHKTAGLIMAENCRKAGRLRQLGFMDTCRQYGIQLDTGHIQEDDLSYEGGQRAAKRLLQQGTLPSSLFIEISDMAIGALPALKKGGVVIPADMEVVTYGDNPMEAFISPSLTTIRLPVEEMSSGCVEMVLRMIETGEWGPVSKIFPLDLVVRESCGGFPSQQP